MHTPSCPYISVQSSFKETVVFPLFVDRLPTLKPERYLHSRPEWFM